jgi:phage FluMu protein Com
MDLRYTESLSVSPTMAPSLPDIVGATAVPAYALDERVHGSVRCEACDKVLKKLTVRQHVAKTCPLRHQLQTLSATSLKFTAQP